MLYNLLYYSHGNESVRSCHEIADYNEPALFSPCPLVRFTFDRTWFYGGLTAGMPDSPLCIGIRNGFLFASRRIRNV